MHSRAESRSLGLAQRRRALVRTMEVNSREAPLKHKPVANGESLIVSAPRSKKSACVGSQVRSTSASGIDLISAMFLHKCSTKSQPTLRDRVRQCRIFGRVAADQLHHAAEACLDGNLKQCLGFSIIRGSNFQRLASRDPLLDLVQCDRG